MRKKIHFEIVSRYDKKMEPATVAVPLPKGELYSGKIKSLKLKKLPEGRCYPAQFRATGFWEDGTVRWLLVHFLGDLPANQETDYELCLAAEMQDKEETGFPMIHVQRGGEYTAIENGSMHIELAKSGQRCIFHRIVTPGHTYGADEIIGPVIKDQEGDEFKAEIGAGGWEVIEEGPVRAVVRTRGRHYCGEKSWFDYALMITVWAGKPWILADYQIINTEDDRSSADRREMVINNEQAGLKYNIDYPYEAVREMKLEIRPGIGGECTGEEEYGIYTSGFNYHVKKGNQEPISELITADTIINTANEMFPEVLFSIFAADWRNRDYGVTAGIQQAYQNFPKALEASGQGICISFLPELNTILKVPQGVAKTTRCYLYFHEVELEDRMLVDRAHQFEMPALPVLAPEVYMEASVLDPYITDQYHHETERFLYRYVDSRAKGLGILNFGDGPEWEYIKQGRSGGELIWINNEYDMPHNFMVMLARTGDRRYYDYMKAAVEHWYDVDLCHYSGQPYRKGLLYTHSVDHVSGQPVPSHQWVEGFLDYYHLTGSPYGLEAARFIGQGLLKLMELPIYHATATVEPREIGWAMRTFMALYRETWEQKWLDACEPIVKVYLKWAEELGTWTTPYPDNYMDRVPFMMHVGIVGLYQYDQVCPSREIKQTMINVVDDMIRYCYIPRADVFFGKQFPAVRFLNLNGMVLESLAIAYELTGDRAYMETGLGMFEWITRENQPPLYDFSKYKHDDYTVIYDCPSGPKRCAQTLLPLLHYYRRAVELGYLKNREQIMNSGGYV